MRKRMKRKNNSGVTLVEMLIATGILAVALGTFYSIELSGTQMWENARLSADLQAQARNAMSFMVSELRNATRTSSKNPSPNLVIPSEPNNKNIEFYLPEDKDDNGFITDSNGVVEWATSNKIHYQYIPGQKTLRRLEKGVHKILAQDVTDVQFIDAAIDPVLAITELKIILTVSKLTERKRNISFTLTSIVRLRN